MEGPTVAQNVNGGFREGSKVDGSLRKVLLPHGKLKEGSSSTRKVHVSLQKVPRMHKKWTEYPADALKLDGRYCRCTGS